jgi:hypothetical protein
MAAVVIGVGSLGARAETVVIDFDPPAFAEGQVLDWVGDVGFFGSPEVFRPTVATKTPPQALRSRNWCATPDCSDGVNALSITLRRSASKVSLMIGSETPPPSAVFCIPEGTDCGVWARLIGFHDGQPIVDSGDVKLYDAGNLSAAMTQELTVSDTYGRITSVLLSVGKGTFSHDAANPGRPQIDHLEVDFIDGAPPPPPPPPPAPSVQILQPTAPISAPYRFDVSGTWSAPAGLLALCIRLNEEPPADFNHCPNNVVFDGDKFWVELYAASLPPVGNQVNAAIFDLAGRRVTASFNLSVGAPPKPSISLYTPQSGVLVPGATPKASGFVVASGPPAGFCIRVVQPAALILTPPLASCQDQHFVGADGRFSNVSMDALEPGSSDVYAFVYDQWGQFGLTVAHVTVPADLRISGLEITQGSQYLNPQLGGAYDGVQLVQGLPTIVRVFAGAVDGGTFPNVNATLEGFYVISPQSGERSLGTLLPDNGARTLATITPLLTPDQRVDPNGAYVFTLPTSWTQQGAIHLRAQVNHPGFGPTVLECAGCDANNVVDVTDIGFRQPFSQQEISPVAVRWKDAAGSVKDPPDPETAFSDLRALAPLSPANLTIHPYVAEVDAGVADLPGGISTTGDCDPTCRALVWSFVGGYGTTGHSGLATGVTTASVRGLTNAYVTDHGIPLVAITSTTYGVAPLKLQVAHEVFHQLHYLHASKACQGGDGQPYESWPADQTGRLHGVGLDRRANSGGTGTYAVVVDRDTPNDAYDIMSYCAPNHPMWLSPRNWDDFGKDLPSGADSCYGDVCAGDAAWVALLFLGTSFLGPEPAGAVGTHVVALRREDGRWTILDAHRRNRPSVQPKPSATANVRFITHDQSGNETASVVADAIEVFDAPGLRVASADLPTTDVASILLEVDGHEAVRRIASPHPPTIAMSDLPKLTPDGQNGQVRLRWRAAAAEGGPVSVRVDYAEDGRHFRTIGFGANPEGMSLPLRLFSAAKAARLRLTANDGLNEAQWISAPFASRGAPPSAAILQPAEDVRMLSTGVLNLAGAGFDDRAEPIADNNVRWTLDGRPWGKGGASRSLVQPAPGRHVVTFTVRDRLGRRASAERVVNVSDGGIHPAHPRPRDAK